MPDANNVPGVYGSDRYARYEDKMRRTAVILDWIRGHRALSCLIVGVFLLILLSGFTIPGLTVKSLALTQSVYLYGDAVTWDAKVLFRPYYAEYAAAGIDGDGSEWSTETPVLPGEYQVRLVKQNVWRVEKRKEPIAFSIVPRPIDVVSADASVIYGQIPTVAADTVYGDTIASYEVSFADLTQMSTDVTVLTDSIRITDKNGVDVTDRYVLQASPVSIAFAPLTVTIYADSADFTYNGKPQQCLTIVSASDLAFSDQYLVVTSATSLQYPQWIKNRLRNTTGLPESVSYTFGETYPAIETYYPDYKQYVTDYPGVCYKNGSVNYLVTTENVQTYAVLDSDGRDYSANYRFVCVPGTLSVTQRNITVLTMDGGTVVYDGLPHTLSEFTVGTDGTGPADGETVVTESLRTYTSVGKYYNCLAVWIVNPTTGYDMSGFYKILLQEGSFEITKRPITVVVPNVTKIYDGNGKSDCTCTVRGGMGLVEGHTLHIQSYPNVSDVGTYKNTVTVRIKDENGFDVTSNYDITYVYGSLTIEPRPLHVTTSSAEKVYDGLPLLSTEYTVSEETPLSDGDSLNLIGYPTITYCSESPAQNTLEFRITHGQTRQKKDVTKNYDIIYEYGTLSITPRPLSVTVPGAQKVYDGTPLWTTETNVHADTPLADGDRLEVTDYPLVTRCREGIVQNLLTFRIVNVKNEDVTDNYAITAEYGTLQITPRYLTITLPGAEREYDGTPLTSDEYVITEGSLPQNHTMTVICGGSQTIPGTVQRTLDSVTIWNASGEDVMDSFVITCGVCGYLKVLPRHVCIDYADFTKEYDGTPLYAQPFYTIGDGSFLPDHTFVCTTNDWQTEIGTREYYSDDYYILDADGQDVTAYYDIGEFGGTLTVTKIALTVTSQSVTQYYTDGAVLENKDCWITGGHLMAGHYLICKVTGELSEIGTAPNTIYAVYVEETETGKDVTELYEIETNPGILRFIAQ